VTRVLTPEDTAASRGDTRIATQRGATQRRDRRLRPQTAR
jgi:hypothetical protein